MEAKMVTLDQLKSARAPSRNPVNQPVRTGELDGQCMREGVAIYSDGDAGGEYRAIEIAETMMRKGERVVVFGFQSLIFGLYDVKTKEGAPEVVRLGGGIHGHTVNENDGDAIADMIVDEGMSVICKLDHLNYAQITKILHCVLERIVVSEDEGITVVFLGLDALITRRRHEKDSKALIQCYNLALRGRPRGINTVITAESPGEIPIEIRNKMKSVIAGRLCSKTQVLALKSIVWSDQIAAKALDYGYGISVMDLGVHWAFLPVQGSADMPVLLPMLSLEGSYPGGSIVKTSDTEKEIVAKLIEAASKRDKDKRKGKSTEQTTNARIGQKVIRTLDADGGKVNVAEVLRAEGRKYYCNIVQTAKLVTATLRTGFRFIDMSPVSAREVIDRARNDRRIEEAAVRACNQQRHTKAYVSYPLMSLLHFMVGNDAAKDVNAFFERVDLGYELAKGDPRLVLRKQLDDMNRKGVPLTDHGRLEAILRAWNAHVAGQSMKRITITGRFPDVVRSNIDNVVALPPIQVRQAA